MRYLSCLICLLGSVVSAAEIEWKDGDRIVVLGSTMIEREQRYGYWETAWTIRHPDKKITFRNLGWSGDTVFGDARAGFGTAADGFKQIKELTTALKPTVILVAYGSNEAFEGSAGLAKFIKGLGTLLDTLAETKAQLMLITPMPLEDHGRPLPDPTEQNKRLALYAQAIRELGAKRQIPVADLFSLLGEGKTKREPLLTDNNMHLTDYGYWATTPIIEKALDWKASECKIEMDAKGASGYEQKGKLSHLPLPVSPHASKTGSGPQVQIKNLKDGKYTLWIDGKRIHTTSAEDWAKGVLLLKSPDLEQTEQLRAAIREKNQLYFYRWRPQNETYLFGFRKHEQGKNAKEVAEFDPLVGKEEERINKFKVPIERTYRWELEK